MPPRVLINKLILLAGRCKDDLISHFLSIKINTFLLKAKADPGSAVCIANYFPWEVRGLFTYICLIVSLVRELTLHTHSKSKFRMCEVYWAEYSSTSAFLPTFHSLLYIILVTRCTQYTGSFCAEFVGLTLGRVYSHSHFPRECYLFKYYRAASVFHALFIVQGYKLAPTVHSLG